MKNNTDLWYEIHSVWSCCFFLRSYHEHACERMHSCNTGEEQNWEETEMAQKSWEKGEIGSKSREEGKLAQKVERREIYSPVPLPSCNCLRRQVFQQRKYLQSALSVSRNWSSTRALFMAYCSFASYSKPFFKRARGLLWELKIKGLSFPRLCFPGPSF